MMSQLQGDPNPNHVHRYCGHIAGEQTDTKDAERRSGNCASMTQHDCQHAEGRNHKVDAGARFLDQKEPVVRKVALSRTPLERRTGNDAHQPGRRRQHPRQLLRRCLCIVALQAPRDEKRHRNHQELRPHSTTPERWRRARSRLTVPNIAATIAASHTMSGSAPLVMPTARSLTPSGSGNGWSTSSAPSAACRTISCTATNEVYRVSKP